ncbi:uncharacterized protein LOC144121266 [Amblyomma americanum]|uniref:Uncharacterized protein n=2 Tax=Amblyomma TaxID=6942 RepID=A0A0C9S021_AMBAM
MAQGKLKVKTSVPKNAKRTPAQSNLRGVSKSRAAPKKAKAITAKQQVKVALEKTIRKNIEQELRSRATSEGKPFATTTGATPSAAGGSKKKRGKKGKK